MDPVEANPQMQVRLAIGVMATAVNQKYQDQIRACINTWCQEATELNVPVYFFGGHLPFSIDNYINLPGSRRIITLPLTSSFEDFNTSSNMFPPISI